MPKQINQRLDSLENKNYKPLITLNEYYDLPDDMKDEINEPWYGKGNPSDGLNISPRILKHVEKQRKSDQVGTG